MAGGRESVEDLAGAFTTFAEAEGDHIPVYAALCRVAAADPDVAGLLLEAPRGQRLPVLLLAALHDVVLRHPDAPLAAWYPSVTGTDAAAGDPGPALHATLDRHGDEVRRLLRTRRVQTNEVNRCTAWWVGLSRLCAADDRPLALVEVGASAGLNLRLDDYAYHLDGTGLDGTEHDGAPAGRTDSPVQLSSVVRGDPASVPMLDRLPPVVHRVGLDQRPVDVRDPDDARWLRACVWPEQRRRFARLDAALDLARRDPPVLVAGDLVEDVPGVLDAAPRGTHVVVLSSWVLAYVSRDDRRRFAGVLGDAAAVAEATGGRLSLLTLEADHVLPWMPPPPLSAEAPAEERHASVLAVTTFGGGAPAAEPLARCQAHLAWIDPVDPGAG